jgi:hypothetical protein
VRLYNDLTVAENLHFFAALSDVENISTRIDDVLALLGCQDWYNRRVGSFSKGMRQWVMLLAVPMIAALALSACGGSSKSSNNSSSSNSAANNQASSAADSKTDTDGDGIPDSAETVLGSDPNNPDTDGDGQNDLADQTPMQADNPITETSTTQGFAIGSILVENNVDTQGADAPDHLELSVTNTTDSDITNFDVYYTITDSTDNKVQSCYRTLPGFTLKAGETKALHFDNTGQPDHYSVNPNSLYYTDMNALTVQVTLHAAGFAPQTASVDKDPGGADGGND